MILDQRWKATHRGRSGEVGDSPEHLRPNLRRQLRGIKTGNFLDQTREEPKRRGGDGCPADAADEIKDVEEQDEAEAKVKETATATPTAARKGNPRFEGGEAKREKKKDVAFDWRWRNKEEMSTVVEWTARDQIWGIKVSTGVLENL